MNTLNALIASFVIAAALLCQSSLVLAADPALEREISSIGKSAEYLADVVSQRPRDMETVARAYAELTSKLTALQRYDDTTDMRVRNLRSDFLALYTVYPLTAYRVEPTTMKHTGSLDEHAADAIHEAAERIIQEKAISHLACHV